MHGIYATGLSGADITSNTVNESVEHGIFPTECSNTVVSGNTSVSHKNINTKFEHRVGPGRNKTQLANNLYGPSRTEVTSAVNPISVDVQSKATSLSNNNYYERISISIAAISGISDKTYTGKAVTQNPTVKLPDKTQGMDRSSTVIIATLRSFKDALSVSPYAYATNSPILFVENNLKLSSSTLFYIKSAKFANTVIVGGTGSYERMRSGKQLG